MITAEVIDKLSRVKQQIGYIYFNNPPKHENVLISKNLVKNYLLKSNLRIIDGELISGIVQEI
ncbi:hypothetical protein KPL47_02210 [Clostridium estertheticum]|uniref:hypothetical protein n=1 Tax=Clostridium estertheticum TaxID=238834 RepID=UPI001C0C0FC8|nr:hypothetical protein [Clostridium estertheticum]MBU3175178.1 hypothetical protein [Clostridium estertheticum]